MTAVRGVEGRAVSRSEFGTALLGYDPVQIRQYLREVETERRQLIADRDAAVEHAEEMVRLLTHERSSNRDLQARLDRVCRSPIEPDGLQERLWRMVVLANDEAAEIIARAQTAALACIDEAEQTATRLFERHECLVAETAARQEAMEAEHAELIQRAQEKIDTMTRDAECRRQQLDDEARRHRERAEDDFARAMADRRARADQRRAEQDAAVRERADLLVGDARERAEQLLNEAGAQLKLVQDLRSRLSNEIREANQVLRNAVAALDEPRSTPSDEPQPA